MVTMVKRERKRRVVANIKEEVKELVREEVRKERVDNTVNQERKVLSDENEDKELNYIFASFFMVKIKQIFEKKTNALLFIIKINI